MIRKYISRYDAFDEVTKFRLKNAVLVSIAMSILSPLLISLKGVYLLPWIISVFSIMHVLSIKTNSWVVERFSLSELYKIGIFIHLLFITNSLAYFYNPEWMVWMDGFTAVFEVAIFSAYSIKLNNYLAKFYPDSMSGFQIIKNSNWADGSLLGLGLVTIITYFGGIPAGVTFFIAFNLVFSIWLIYNWKFYDDIDY